MVIFLLNVFGLYYAENCHVASSSNWMHVVDAFESLSKLGGCPPDD